MAYAALISVCLLCEKKTREARVIRASNERLMQKTLKMMLRQKYGYKNIHTMGTKTTRLVLTDHGQNLLSVLFCNDHLAQ